MPGVYQPLQIGRDRVTVLLPSRRIRIHRKTYSTLWFPNWYDLRAMNVSRAITWAAVQNSVLERQSWLMGERKKKTHESRTVVADQLSSVHRSILTNVFPPSLIQPLHHCENTETLWRYCHYSVILTSSGTSGKHCLLRTWSSSRHFEKHRMYFL